MLEGRGRAIEDTEVVLWSPLTIVFKSRISVGVISDGSTRGSGLFVDFNICKSCKPVKK